MGWADNIITKLQTGETVTFRSRGSSMKGKIDDGDLVEVAPLSRDPKVGDIVLCQVRGNQYLHKVTAVDGSRYQIGNNRGYINGWIGKLAIYGILIANHGKAKK